MERIIITIETGNAAFEDSPTGEIGRILRDLADRFEQNGIPDGNLLDINGNVCGSVQVD
jgi:hypothetical protein